jgi:hypothetical protein
MSAGLGFIAFIILLFVIDAVVKSDGKRAAWFGIAFASCVAVILLISSPPPPLSMGDCWIEWDIRVSRTVCD